MASHTESTAAAGVTMNKECYTYSPYDHDFMNPSTTRGQQLEECYKLQNQQHLSSATKNCKHRQSMPSIGWHSSSSKTRAKRSSQNPFFQMSVAARLLQKSDHPFLLQPKASLQPLERVEILPCYN